MNLAIVLLVTKTRLEATLIMKPSKNHKKVLYCNCGAGLWGSNLRMETLSRLKVVMQKSFNAPLISSLIDLSTIQQLGFQYESIKQVERFRKGSFENYDELLRLRIFLSS
jgi:hypothetical protein